MSSTRVCALLIFLFLRFEAIVPGNAAALAAEPDIARGGEIYAASCAACHGEQGQGVESAYEDPLIGDESVGQLAARIAKTMPEGEPESCVGEDARAVAAFIHHSFYSEAAQLRNRPPSIGLARLTAEQLRQSLADLYEQFSGRPQLKPSKVEHGVHAAYFDGNRYRRENLKIERVDATLDFDFGHDGPGGGVQAEEFYILWEGGLWVETTGAYELVVHSTCSFVMDFGREGRELINNHTQSGDKIEFRRKMMLTGGRVYPFKLEFVQRKRKTQQPPARIALAWVPPGGVEQPIPHRNLVSQADTATFALQTRLPPDDRSYGFERGIAINREWDASTTSAALEFAQAAAEELWPDFLQSQRKQPGTERDKLRTFLQRILETAFRAPLDEELEQTYVGKHLAVEVDNAEAIKRVLLVSLKSPRFLYPQADATQPRSRRVANRLMLTLCDSLPSDPRLLEAIQRNELATEEQARSFAEELLDDYRTQAKTFSMLHEWLNLAGDEELAKDDELYPGFNARLVQDLRQSLNAFLHEVVWEDDASDYRNLFTARWTLATGRMNEFYGFTSEFPEAGLSGLQRVELESSHGLLSHPYLLSRLAYHDTTSPIHRGVFLIRYLLGRTLRPPADAFAPLSPDLHPELTTRDRVELQTSPESCQVCHVKINGLGFVLEGYDAVGRGRELENGSPVDTTGYYVARDGQQVEFAGIGDLAHYLADSDDAQRAFVGRAFQHFVKQPAAAFGAETLDNLTEKFRKSQFNIRRLLVEIAVLSSLSAVDQRPTKAL